jgi:hypothetical protein
VAVAYTLQRMGDGGLTSVPAALLDAQPYAITVTTGATTNLVLHFAVAGVGTIAFPSGTLETSLVFDAGTYPARSAQVSGSQTFTGSSAYGVPAAVENLGALDSNPANNAWATTVPGVIVTATQLSPFTMAVDSACATANLTASFASGSDAGATGTPLNNITSLLEEWKLPGQICVYDTNYTANPLAAGTVSFSSLAAHAPTTPVVTSALGPDAGVPEFYFAIVGTPPQPLLAGNVLSLNLVNQPITLSPATVDIELLPASGGSITLYGSATTALTLQMKP